MSGATLQRLQVELGDLVIGSDTRVPLGKIGGLGTAPLREVTYENASADGRQFGREYRGGQDITLEGSIAIAGDESGAWDVSTELDSWFDGDSYRRNPRLVTSMRLRRPGGQTRVVFGRPDRYDPELDQAVYGFIPWSAIFRTSDGTFYSDVEHQLRLTFASESSGHIIAPSGILTAPIRTTNGGQRAAQVANVGTKATWPVISIKGPVAEPFVELVGPTGSLWRLAIDGDLLYDQTAVIDTRPWSRGASLDGGPLGKPLSTDSVPSKAGIPPGTFDVLVGGVDNTGTSEFLISWRDAYKKL